MLDRVVEGYKEGRNLDIFATALPKNAKDIRDAFDAGDLEAAGNELRKYHSLCNILSPNFMPEELKPVMAF